MGVGNSQVKSVVILSRLQHSGMVRNAVIGAAHAPEFEMRRPGARACGNETSAGVVTPAARDGRDATVRASSFPHQRKTDG